MPGVCEAVVMTVLAVVFPPLPVLLETGCSTSLLLNVVLTILGWLPGVIHALFIIFSMPGALVVGGRTAAATTTTYVV